MKNELPDWLIGRLPEYEKVDSISQAFSDSTHQLWRLQCSSLDGKNHFLKVCSHTDSPFWRIMQDLFGFDLRTEIASFSNTYAFIDKACGLEIPELIEAETIDNNKAYILTSVLNGNVTGSNIKDQRVQQLANHLAELHSNSSNTWGSLNNPIFHASDWSLRLETTLIESAKKWGGVFLQSDEYLKQALEACALIKTTEFISMMPDLRWDQFLQKDDVISALVDLDAFVFAPRELDFVILEYLLFPDQIRIFSDVYSKHHDIPEIKQARPAYLLLLFYMQILGETDLDGWMNREALF